MTAVNLRRVDPAPNMRRFYRLDMQPDLFGGVLLAKEWGRIGAQALRALTGFVDWTFAARSRRTGVRPARAMAQ